LRGWFVYCDVAGVKYRVECTPSFLLALAVALAGESLSYIDIYRQLVRQVVEMREYRAAGRVGELLKEKWEKI